MRKRRRPDDRDSMHRALSAMTLERLMWNSGFPDPSDGKPNQVHLHPEKRRSRSPLHPGRSSNSAAAGSIGFVSNRSGRCSSVQRWNSKG
jgi:hypothetical protein